MQMLSKYIVFGRRLPNERIPSPEVYKMTIYAKNEIAANSRFWYHLNILKKIKKTKGEIVLCKRVEEDDTHVKNFGVVLRFRSRVGQHNMYREVRETTSARAVEKIYADLAGQCRTRALDIQIINVNEITNPEDLRREKTIIFNDANVAFPHPFPLAHAKRSARVKPFQTRRPTLSI